MLNNIKYINSINKGGDAMYGIQVRIGGLNFSKVENSGSKPSGGLWTASLLKEEMGSSWTEWCEWEEFNLPEGGTWKAYLLQPNNDARIYTIDSHEDIEYILNKYNSKYSIDFEAMSKDYDALHVTDCGLGAAYELDSDLLYGWDLESTVWFNEAYTVIEEVTWPVVDRHIKVADPRSRNDVIKHVTLKKGNKGTYAWRYKDNNIRMFLAKKLFAIRRHDRVFRCMKVSITHEKRDTRYQSLLARVEILQRYWFRDEIYSMLYHAAVEDYYDTGVIQ